MAKEAGPLPGFRDMLSSQMIARQKMTRTIQDVYKNYGFSPLDTPIIEKAETLKGKYGDDEKLIYKFEDHGGREVALRYDLTVPLARVVKQHQSDIPLPYKRYQSGDVFRADRPQAGRYREFMQFDADTVAAKGSYADAETVMMMVDTMSALGARSQINVNNRRLLDAVAEKSGAQTPEEARKLITSVDKLDKIGLNAVLAEVQSDFGDSAVSVVQTYLTPHTNNDEYFSDLDKLLGKTEAGQEGLDNMKTVFSIIESAGFDQHVVFNPAVARGLSYYTGIIYETTLVDLPKIGSVCSGGRFDNLMKQMGGPDLPAVGTSVGVDRLFEGLRQLGQLEDVKTLTQALIVNSNEKKVGEYARLATELRRAGYAIEVHSDSNDKVGKQLRYADKQEIPYAILLGDEGITLKNMKTGEQTPVSKDEIGKYLS